MRTLSNNFTKYIMYFVISIFAVGFTSCSDDDDVDLIIEPTGSITVQDNQTISQNQIVIENVTVGQDTWVVAVMGGDENTNNFITDPVLVQEGSNSDVELTFDDDVNFTGGEAGDEISIKLYADNPNEGTLGEWDIFDDPIMEDDVIVTETITVFTDDGDEMTFSDFDADGDGFLDADEILNTYENDFTGWDLDADGELNEEEFFNTTFANTDADDDDLISEEEWNQGYTSMYSNYLDEDDFTVFDTDADGSLSAEEWGVGFAETDWFTTYDVNVNNSISEEEWDTGLYGDWDMDGDGLIDEDEYNNYSPYSFYW